jgi:lysosomal alpha-mannosidase
VNNSQQIHRRLLHDDAFGVGEALNETAYGVGLAARGSHWLGVENSRSVARFLAQRMAHSPILTFSPTTLSAEEFRKSYRMEVSGVVIGKFFKKPFTVHTFLEFFSLPCC